MRIRGGNRFCIALYVAFFLIAWESRGASAGDWPQILGPNRNGVAEKESIFATFPKSGPKTVWEYPVGHGYAGVAVAEGKLVLFHRLADEAVVECLDAASGKPQWKQSFPTHYVSTIAPDDGPRCVPLIHEGSVYLFGADGDLHSLRMADGRERWSRNVNQEYSPPPAYFGAGSTPIVDSGKLLVNVGGRGAGLVAFALADGKTVWQSTDEAPSYSSPVAATFAGRRQVVFITRLNVVSVDPEKGTVKFQFPFGQRGPTVNAANPLIVGKQLFVTASYGIGAQLAAVNDNKPTAVWENDSSLSSQYATPVEKDGVLYGLHGRQDGPPAELRAVDVQTGKVLWAEKNFGAGNLIRVGDKLLIMKIDGELVLAEANPKQYQQLASHKLFETTVQPLPAVSGGRLYVRDTKTLKCVDLRP